MPLEPDDRPDAELIGELFSRHAAALELYARQLCAVPEDVVQEAFIQLAAQKETPREIVPWLYRVVRNRALNATRSRRRRRDRETAHPAASWFIEQTENRLDACAATKALAELDRESREVIVSRLWGGMSFVEIGQLLGISDSTAHRRYQEALQTLRERLNYSAEESNGPHQRSRT